MALSWKVPSSSQECLRFSNRMNDWIIILLHNRVSSKNQHLAGKDFWPHPQTVGRAHAIGLIVDLAEIDVKLVQESGKGGYAAFIHPIRKLVTLKEKKHERHSKVVAPRNAFWDTAQVETKITAREFPWGR